MTVARKMHVQCNFMSKQHGDTLIQVSRLYAVAERYPEKTFLSVASNVFVLHIVDAADHPVLFHILVTKQVAHEIVGFVATRIEACVWFVA